VKFCLSNRKRAQALVELLVIVPMLIVIGFGLLHLLRLVNHRQEQERALREKMMQLKSKRRYRSFRIFHKQDPRPAEAEPLDEIERILLYDPIHFGDS